MPLPAESHIPIPTKDILSWCYEKRHFYDQDKPIYIDTATDESISASQAYTTIRKLIAGWRALGLKKGDGVAIHSFNHLFYPLLVQSILGAGGIFLGTNPSYTSYELTHALATSHTKFLLAAPDLLSAPKNAAKTVGIPDDKILIFADADHSGHRSWRTLFNHGEEDWVSFDDEETSRNTTAFLMFSSGTTGLPKAAEVSHYNLIAQHTLVHENPAHATPFQMSSLQSLPFFHAAAAPYTHVSTLRSGFPSHIMRRFEPWAYLDAVAKYRTTRIMVVPPMVIALLNCALVDEARVRKSLSSVRQAVAGAAPLSAETQARLQALLPKDTPFTQIWAMTETSCVASYFYPPENDDTGSVGRFMPSLDVKLVDVDGSDVEVGPYDTRGEICIRGPTVIRGYLDNPAANAESWDKDGFFHTGDIAVCDGKTKLWYIVDRKKELIKVRGFQCAPAEIEGVLLQHPAVADVAVIGVDGDASGELPRAFVVRRKGIELSGGDVKGWVKERLAGYKQLEGGVRFVEQIPKNASGKILKRVVREWVKREGAAKL
ncbi:hypothetical protein M409DRAFT_20441 [Zasmidium cellare ATCC 36951]|uniref:Acetyl-CoA synthetase-like protein n=1 Tax=Zasmidium cellare ATCC 36951 TaxID=1080233 RepID=A0A6A6CSQ8_ZASCE|nr:uncharacterized protein M409DRAFT_20441 [Zasmidium cellare ATCC 36951]KAF2169218.1 hypothetical protein M409DRAFT_20441 [Zasmidium cellare ATCC 36951]